MPLTLARGNRSVHVSDDTIWWILRELHSAVSGREFGERITNWDRKDPLELSDEEYGLIQNAADLTMKKRPPAAVHDELMSLRLLRD